ncbi:hypothetical protein GYB22_06065 [bacterium]|nr:hypothetical protein [bacterium]
MPFERSKGPRITIKDLASSAEDLEEANNRTTILLLHLMKNDPELFNEVKFKSLEIEKSAKYPLAYINKLQAKLEIEEDSQISLRSKSIVSNAQIDSLFNRIRLYRSSLKQLLDYNTLDEIDNVLPSSEYAHNAKGELVPIHSLFFPEKAEAEEVAQGLAALQLAVVRSKAIALDQMIRKSAMQSAVLKSFDQLRLNNEEDLEDVLHSRSLAEFFNTIESVNFTVAPDTIRRSLFYIEKYNAAQVDLGDLLKFNIQFKFNLEHPFIIRIDSRTEHWTYTLPASGHFVFHPPTAGSYRILFQQADIKHSEQILVKSKDDIIGQGSLPTLYANIENELNIKPVIAGKRYPVEVKADKGQIVQRGEQFFASFNSSGQVNIKVFAQMPYGKVLIDRKSYMVSNTPAIRLQFKNYTSGSEISKTELQNIQFAQLSSDLELGSAAVKEFQIFRISGNTVTPPITNYGEQFNSAAQSLFTQCVPGDLIVVNRIKIRSPKGLVQQIAPYTVYVR